MDSETIEYGEWKEDAGFMPLRNKEPGPPAEEVTGSENGYLGGSTGIGGGGDVGSGG